MMIGRSVLNTAHLKKSRQHNTPTQLALCEVCGVEKHDLLKALLKEVSRLL